MGKVWEYYVMFFKIAIFGAVAAGIINWLFFHENYQKNKENQAQYDQAKKQYRLELLSDCPSRDGDIRFIDIACAREVEKIVNKKF